MGLQPLDLRDRSFDEVRSPLLQAAERLGPKEGLDVQLSTIPWPALAALQANGFVYTFRANGSNDHISLHVSRRYTHEERQRYLKARLRPRETLEIERRYSPAKISRATSMAPTTSL